MFARTKTVTDCHKMLRFPVFIGSFTTEGQQALERLHSRLPKELGRFIAESVSELPDQLRDDQKYDMRLRVYLELVKNPASGLPSNSFALPT
jgi:hypothetical protein